MNNIANTTENLLGNVPNVLGTGFGYLLSSQSLGNQNVSEDMMLMDL